MTNFSRFTPVKEIIKRDYKREYYLKQKIFDDLDREYLCKVKELEKNGECLQQEAELFNKKRAAALGGY